MHEIRNLTHALLEPDRTRTIEAIAGTLLNDPTELFRTDTVQRIKKQTQELVELHFIEIIYTRPKLLFRNPANRNCNKKYCRALEKGPANSGAH